MSANSELAILSRVIKPKRAELPPNLARLILQWEFPETDRERMHALLDKAKAGRWARAEKAEAERYERVGHLLSVLKSKARISLKANGAAP